MRVVHASDQGDAQAPDGENYDRYERLFFSVKPNASIPLYEKKCERLNFQARDAIEIVAM